VSALAIRGGNQSDLDGLLVLCQEMHDGYLYRDIALDLDQLRGWLDNAITAPDWIVLVALLDGEMIGMMVGSVSRYFFGPELVATDHLFYVRKGSRGGVAAKQLVERYRQWAELVGCREACLSSSCGLDVSAFYERVGFGQVGTVHKVRLGG
jgi:GNAT superfamily N-acetyltransferase